MAVPRRTPINPSNSDRAEAQSPVDWYRSPHGVCEAQGSGCEESLMESERKKGKVLWWDCCVACRLTREEQEGEPGERRQCHIVPSDASGVIFCPLTSACGCGLPKGQGSQGRCFTGKAWQGGPGQTTVQMLTSEARASQHDLVSSKEK